MIILGITTLTLPWIGPASRGYAPAVGTLWLVAMLAFEFSLGRIVFRMKGDRILADFDPRRGGLLGLGMLVLLFAPNLVACTYHLF